MNGKKEICIGCIGDSITAGTGLANPAIEAFPARLQELLGENVKVFNFGNGGKTMRSDLGVDSYVNSSSYESLMQNAKDLDVVTVMLGTNDAYHAKGWTEYESSTFKKDCRALFTALCEQSPSAVFVLMNSPECFGEKAARYDMIPLRALQANLADELKRDGFTTYFFDMHSVTAPLGEHFPDKLHPNATAHMTMAKALAELIFKMINDIS